MMIEFSSIFIYVKMIMASDIEAALVVRDSNKSLKPQTEKQKREIETASGYLNASDAQTPEPL